MPDATALGDVGEFEDFDVIVIGAGQAGPALAGAARDGERVALVEQRALGGTCVNDGCTPTKTLRKSARVAHVARRAGEFGIITGPVEVDFAAAMTRMRDIAVAARRRLEDGLGRIRVAHPRRRPRRGRGRVDDRFVVRVGERSCGRRSWCSTPGPGRSSPPIDGLDEVAISTTPRYWR
ncbi:MAG: FAD-dependent oxidoreductase [Acidimicrobiales bacterium]